MHDVQTVLLTGVGGQGTILAGDLLARVAAASGMDVKLAEVHGMSQRGGAVDTVVRFGPVVYSPVVDAGAVDYLVAFEVVEAARWVHYVRPEGVMLVNTRQIASLPVLTGAVPSPVGLLPALQDEGAVLIDAEGLARAAGNARAANLVLMGALAAYLPFDESVWTQTITSRVPSKTVDVNLAAFALGSAEAHAAWNEGGVAR